MDSTWRYVISGAKIGAITMMTGCAIVSAQSITVQEVSLPPAAEMVQALPEGTARTGRAR